MSETVPYFDEKTSVPSYRPLDVESIRRDFEGARMYAADIGKAAVSDDFKMNSITGLFEQYPNALMKELALTPGESLLRLVVALPPRSADAHAEDDVSTEYLTLNTISVEPVRYFDMATEGSSVDYDVLVTGIARDEQAGTAAASVKKFLLSTIREISVLDVSGN